MKTTIQLAALFVAFNSLANSHIDIPANDGFMLKASYFSAEKSNNTAVLMLHQCNFNRSMYNQIGKRLSEQGSHALSIDFRGYGDSKSSAFDVSKIANMKKQERATAWKNMTQHWPQDVEIAYEFLRNKVGENGKIGVIGASCGGSQAITLAQNNPVSAIGFFSSAQSYSNIQKYVDDLSDKPTMIIASEEDGTTYTSAQTLFTESKNANSRFLVYKGKGHGYPLLDQDKNLANTLSHWFTQQLAP
ncbi:alpha/beta hydrolase [Pseudoalteromonas obscura]|uniref:Alpha/beta hydrolase n=1 Tax=Pseudoalteromonas obscura TaxID=3048491 RepID=A0ABT7EPE8_9GAMM|nr:alpha/beta hydrolase [Pseudoalteromonas sp. P94(2023)]MDK2596924.1 alpha/beta hydrolase [Pseudoalteromonas sp. P94(2023)]